jgi:hypothetical protein
MSNKVNTKNVENLANVVAVKESNDTKGFKPSNAVTSQNVKPKFSEAKARFINFVVKREEIGMSKFFKMFAEFKANDIKGYEDFLVSKNLDFATDYTFKWFTSNCPTMLVNGKKEFAKWVKVSEKNPLNENELYNRTSEKGTQYTLKPYLCTKANWESYLSMFTDVINEVKRLQRVKAAEKAAIEKAANESKKALKSLDKHFKGAMEFVSTFPDLEMSKAVIMYAKANNLSEAVVKAIIEKAAIEKAA